MGRGKGAVGRVPVPRAFREISPCVLLLEIFALGRWLLTGRQRQPRGTV